jgi:non-ribosomal peptide synthetase component F/NRPS condensation-like uncharacterized protein/acyl carrier protein
VLGRDSIGRTANFFDLGGHSLLATQLLSRLEVRYGYRPELRDLFAEPTVAALARKIETRPNGLEDIHAHAHAHAYTDAHSVRLDQTSASVIPKKPRQGLLPVSYAQQRLWVVQSLDPENTAYNMPAAALLTGRINMQALQRALKDIIHRHEIFGYQFREQHGTLLVESVDPAFESNFSIITWEGEESSAQEAFVREQSERFSHIHFDLVAERPWRIRIIQLSASQSVLLVTMHHIISDGWSVGVLLRELMALYNGYVRGEEVELPALPIQYVDYAVWQRERLTGACLEGHLSYWRETLKGAPPLLNLPLDRARPAVQSHRGAQVRFELDAELVSGLKGVAKGRGATLFMVLLGCYQLVLSRYAQQEDVCVGIPVAGRDRRELEGLIGFFVNAVVVRLDVSGKPSVGELLDRVREQTLGAYAHQEVPAELLLEALKVERHLSYGPLAQVGFALQNVPLERDLHLDGVSVELLEYGHVTAKYDLTLLLEEREDRLVGVAEYATDLFDRETIAGFVAHYCEVLKWCVESPCERSTGECWIPGESELLRELNEQCGGGYSGVYPLTAMQRDLVLSSELRPQTLENSLGYAVELHHEVDVAHWRAALLHYSQRYGVLRSELVRGWRGYHERYYRAEREAQGFELNLEVADLSDRYTPERVREWIASRIYRPYRLTGEALVNHYLYRLGPSHWLTILSSHHLVLDGVGYAEHLLGVCREYSSRRGGEALPDLEADRFAELVKRDRAQTDRGEALNYWRGVLDGVSPLHWPIAEEAGEKRCSQTRVVSKSEREEIGRYCRAHGVTPALYWKSLYAVLIGGLSSGSGEVVLHEFVSGRERDEQRALGCYYRVQPYVLGGEYLSRSGRFSACLGAAKAFWRSSRGQGGISIGEQMRLLSAQGIRYLYNYVHFYPELEVESQRERIEQWIPQAEGSVQFVVKGVGEELELSLDGSERHLSRGDELDLLLSLSRQVVSGKDALNALIWAEEEEAKRLVRDAAWRGEALLEPPIRGALEKSLLERGAREAVKRGVCTLSYAELERCSREVAALLASEGCEAGDRVVLLSGRSVESVVVWLALVRLGCSYIPLEGEPPRARLEQVLMQSGAKGVCVGVESGLMESVQWLRSWRGERDEQLTCAERGENLKTPEQGRVAEQTEQTGQAGQAGLSEQSDRGKGGQSAWTSDLSKRVGEGESEIAHGIGTLKIWSMAELLEKIKTEQAAEQTAEQAAEQVAERATGQAAEQRTVQSTSGGKAIAPAYAAHREFYRIYTSGSTGEPKGVRISEESVSHLANWYVSEYGLGETDRHLLLGSLSFDLTQKNLYGALLSGGCLVLPEGEEYAPERLRDQMRAEGVSVVNGAPSVVYPLLEGVSRYADLRLLLLGGEKPELNRLHAYLRAHGDLELVNMYGPTECTDISCCYRLRASEALDWLESREGLPIGGWIPGVVGEIRNRYGRVAAAGASGELWIGGIGLGLGYDRESLTAERFEGEGDARRYYSGDCVRWHETGRWLQYEGRLDRQVKLRGMRVELGEIENGLRAGLQQEAAYAEVVDGVLVGFVQGEVQEDWREALRAWLPQGWIPGRLVSVAAWPLNTNGKLDRQALCALARRERPEERYDAPQTDLEREIAEIWSEVLGRDSIGRTANFFDLGGHSLLATQLLSRLCERFHLEIGLQTLFEQVTVMQLAKHIQVIRQAEEDALQQGSDDEALEEIDI